MRDGCSRLAPLAGLPWTIVDLAGVGRLPTGRLRLLLRAEPALAPRRAHGDARVVRRPRHQVDLAAGGDGPFDRAAIWRIALGRLPNPGPEFRRALGLAPPKSRFVRASLALERA